MEDKPALQPVMGQRKTAQHAVSRSTRRASAICGTRETGKSPGRTRAVWMNKPACNKNAWRDSHIYSSLGP